MVLRHDRLDSPFAALLKAIVYQQLSGKAAATIHGRVLERAGARKRIRPEQVLELPEDELRAAGLSRAKTAAVRDLAEKTRDGLVPTQAKLRKMDDEAIVAALTAVRGIGRWSAEMLLLFRLGRPDVWPVHDLGVQRGYQLLNRNRELPTPKQLAAAGEAWRPFRSVAAWYLWRATEVLAPVAKGPKATSRGASKASRSGAIKKPKRGSC
jgi:DNA-3-methyladenine glycosylase II